MVVELRLAEYICRATMRDQGVTRDGEKFLQAPIHLERIE